MKKIYLVPNIITAFGLACGLFVIFKVNMIEPGMGDYQVIFSSSLLLVVAAFADFVDGAVARVFRAESPFGFMFDSLADTVSFGVAPSVLLLKTLSLEQGTFLSFFTAVGAMVFSLCGVLRLVRYNVKAMLPSKKADKKEHKPFTGLPITAAAAAAVSINLMLLSPWFLSKWYLEHTYKSIFLGTAMVFLGYLMVSRLKFPTLKALHFRIPSFHLAFLAVVLSAFILYGVFSFFSLVLAFFSWGYIICALGLAIARKFFGRKSKTLKEFEPEEED